MYVADSPSRSAQLNAGAYALANHLFYQRTLRIVGVNQTMAERVSALLPQQNSNLWWFSHLPSVERMIALDAHVAKVDVSICRDGWLPRLGCFSIAVTPRQAEYLVLAVTEVRLVALDGVVLESVAIKDFNSLAERIIDSGEATPRVLRGIYKDQPSSDIATARFARVVNSVKQLESQLVRRIESIEFVNSGEIEVRLDGTKFPVRFNIDSLTSLNDQADRFSRLEREISGKLDLVEMVDMAFDKLGVVRYSQRVISPVTPKGAKASSAVKSNAVPASATNRAR